MSNSNELLFLHNPISDEAEDKIGFSNHVDVLSAAIDSGAQIIAITSPFGSGKSSLIELLKNKRKNETKKGIIRRNKPKNKNEQVLSISMWTHLNHETEEELHNRKDYSIDLHKTLVYQISSQIDKRLGAHISKRLSSNYGLLKLSANRRTSWWFVCISAVLFLLSWIANTWDVFVDSLKWITEENIGYYTVGAVLAATIFLVFAVAMSDIVFSSKNSEKGRIVELDEILDLYRADILGYGCFKKHYIIVIEDLDRTKDKRAIHNFLTELRKYYLLNENQLRRKQKFKNRITFIVNIMPEAQLLEGITGGNTVIYEKVFDYILNLQTVNIDNYEDILEGILQEKKAAILNCGLSLPKSNKLIDIPGMEWMIRGQKIGIRQIKERLNIAFSIYQSLIAKFPSDDIAFEKCAVVAYLQTAFPKAFFATDDKSFDNLIEYYLAHKDASEDEFERALGVEGSKDYAHAVQQLIKDQLIDSTYKIYFYNYPKNSNRYTSDELCVMNAILYGESSEDLNNSAAAVFNHSRIFNYSYNKIRKLGISLPAVVFSVEELYLSALQEFYEGIDKYFKDLDYKEPATRTIEFYINILKYDRKREVCSPDVISKYCDIWQEKFTEPSLLQLRSELCKRFSYEIKLYNKLFFSPHQLIRIAEINDLDLSDAISLVNIQSAEFSVKYVDHIVNAFNSSEVTQDLINKVKNFLVESIPRFDAALLSPALFMYMNKICEIVPEFEDVIFDIIDTGSEAIPSSEYDTIVKQYQEIINKTAPLKGISRRTINNIKAIDCYSGYNDNVIDEMYKASEYLTYIMMCEETDYSVPFDDQSVFAAAIENAYWINAEHSDIFLKIREDMMCCRNIQVKTIKPLYDDRYPIMQGNELSAIIDRGVPEEEILEYIPPNIVSIENSEILLKLFNRKVSFNKLTSRTYEILKYVSELSPDVAKSVFSRINFDFLLYSQISKLKKTELESLFSEILELNTVDGKLAYMRMTRYINSEWENQISEAVKSNPTYGKQYIDVVNSSKGITKNSIDIICSLSPKPIMSPDVNRILFEHGKYEDYILSKTRGSNVFTIEKGTNGDTLWPFYIKIMAADNYVDTCEIMRRNRGFLERIMELGAYVNFPEAKRMFLADVFQNEDSIVDVVTNYSEGFAKKYFSSISGFIDETAATRFVSEITSRENLLLSKEIYDNTYDKLISPTLKGKYTYAKNKAKLLSLVK